jgi:hypothetical protein
VAILEAQKPFVILAIVQLNFIIDVELTKELFAHIFNK